MKKLKGHKPTIIKIGTEQIEIGPDAVPKKSGKSKEEIIKALKKAVREGVFPPIATTS